MYVASKRARTHTHTHSTVSIIGISRVGTANRVMELEVKIENFCIIYGDKPCLRCLADMASSSR